MTDETSSDHVISLRAVPFATRPYLPIAAMLMLAAAFALILPANSGPDEIGHLAYVAALAHGHLPRIVIGHVTVADIRTGTSWQGQHPPLYYLLATPFYMLTGNNPLVELYLLRLAGAGILAVTLLLLRRLASLVLPPDRVHVAVWLVALHPTVVYVSSMVNNEALAMAFSIACVWAAVESRQTGSDDPVRKRKWLALAALMGGLGLLTKLTAIGGVAAAAYAVAQDRSDRKSGLNGLLILAGAVAMWLPWGLAMHHLYGMFVPSPVQQPTFGGGLWALFIFPREFLRALGITFPEFAVGMLCPYWLYAPLDLARPMLVVGWLLIGWVLTMTATRPPLRFVGVGFAVLATLAVSQVLFRDFTALLLLARYSPTATILASLFVASAYRPRTPQMRVGLTALWGALVAGNVIYIFYFFLVGISALKK